jgi:RNA polymerase sigma-70 factor (ECF subfamily)
MTSSEFKSMFSKIETLLFGFAMRLTRNKENAKDLMQETLCKAFESKDRFRKGTNFKAWMTTIMRNSYINAYRKEKTRKKTMAPVDDFLYTIENTASKDKIGRSIMGKELIKIINQLKDKHRIPFMMHFQGYQYDEIATDMDIPFGTVKSRIFFARNKLRKMIEAHYGKDYKVLLRA